MKLEQTVALVTGANRGLGRALVASALKRGLKRVYAAARDPAQLDEIQALDRSRVVPIRLDVTNAAQIREVAKLAEDVTLLINNAGSLASFDLLDTPLDRLHADLEVNFLGTLAVSKALLPALERNGGRIANVLTVVSFASMPGLGGYSASKAAAFSMTQALRAQLAKKGVRVHAVYPGPIDTDMIRSFDMTKASPESVAAAILDGLENDVDDILPDPMSREVFKTWLRSPKDLERQFGGM